MFDTAFLISGVPFVILAVGGVAAFWLGCWAATHMTTKPIALLFTFWSGGALATGFLTDHPLMMLSAITAAVVAVCFAYNDRITYHACDKVIPDDTSVCFGDPLGFF